MKKTYYTIVSAGSAADLEMEVEKTLDDLGTTFGNLQLLGGVSVTFESGGEPRKFFQSISYDGWVE